MSESPVLSNSQKSLLSSMRHYAGVQDLSNDPPATMKMLDLRYSTLDSTITCLTVLKKIYPGVKLFADESRSRSKISIENRKKQIPTEKAEEKSVAWSDVLTWRKEHWSELNPQEKLLIALYTMRPPARADYTPMKIVKKKPSKLEDNTNYLVWNTVPYFIFHAYKTHKTYGDLKFKIMADLKRVLASWIKDHPEAVYLLQDGSNQPWTANHLSKAVQDIFQKYHGLATGITALRHSYLTEYYTDTPAILTMEKVGREMMHSIAVGQQYRHITHS